MSYTDKDFTTIECDGEFVAIQCVNCGAYAQTREGVRHHKNCGPGESARWEKTYEEANEEDIDP